MRTIFVHLTSYCDPELVPSIEDCISKATHPEALHFGICWQHEPEDNALAPYKNDSQFRIDDVLAVDAKGCCWARSRSQAIYGGEDYVLQLDSHHRFAPSWDETLIRMMQQTGVPKPCITAYAGSYTAEAGLQECVPWIIRPKPFSRDGSLQFVPIKMPNLESRTKPAPARIPSGHFFFTLGKHCREVPYDPDLYFLGEELVMGVRSFTHGYDLFHPHELVVWHQYHRDGRKKFWGDQPQKHTVLDKISKDRVLKLMGMEDNDHDLGIYGLGTERTLADYEAFIGIDFKNRRQHEDAINGIDPPTVPSPEKMAVGRSIFVHWSSKEIQIPEDCQFVAYFVEAEDNTVLWRKDAHAADDFQIDPKVEFCSAKEPHHLIVWPHINGKGWGKKFSLILNKDVVYFPH